MSRDLTSILLTVAFLFSTTAVPTPLHGAARRTQATGEPKLIVVLVADQMRADYLERYSGKFSGGLRRLMENGAWFERAMYPYLNTITCAGHSTIGTGTFPYQHGMILNAWLDRKTGKTTECTDDAKEKEINYNGLTGPGDSGRRIRAPSLADAVRRQRGRVVTMSLKARSAIGLAGHGGAIVLWFDTRGGWQTSTAFTKKPTPFVQEYIANNRVESAYGQAWERLYDVSAYQGTDDDSVERAPTGWTRTFPHVIGSKSGKTDEEFYGHWMRSPLSDEYLGRLAATAVDTLRLGNGPQIDFLGVSFSALDLVGHAYGPDSHEVQDMVARLDVTIGALLDHLDRTVGAGKYVVAFTADHGVAQIPEETKRGGRETNVETAAAIEKALVPLLGPGKHVANASYTDIYLQKAALKRMKKDPAVRTAALDALRGMTGIAAAYTADEVSASGARSSSDSLKRAAALNYFPGRSGDVIIVPRENWILSTSATTHGTLYPYDQHVPVIFYGAGVKKGRFAVEASPADIAPTLAALVGIPFRTTDGRERKEAFAVAVSTR
ncbi:MAG TPA: alkaline phosphatase family protein [Vicinamibacterales bacterium]|nr:alkaline phosphatase family protein [Vicinamibacterales bacterium]